MGRDWMRGVAWGRGWGYGRGEGLRVWGVVMVQWSNGPGGEGMVQGEGLQLGKDGPWPHGRSCAYKGCDQVERGVAFPRVGGACTEHWGA